MGRIIAALHRMGFDMVYDTVTGADLTVIEEANEFVDRVQNGGTLPLFTSCCPAWIQFAEKKHPELLPNISTCRSPMGMFAAVIKEYYKDRLPEGKTSHYHVALMPCTAKKFEAKRDEFKTEMGPNTDDVITTQELIRMIKRSGISNLRCYVAATDLFTITNWSGTDPETGGTIAAGAASSRCGSNGAYKTVTFGVNLTFSDPKKAR